MCMKVLRGVLAGIIITSAGNTAAGQTAGNLYVTEVHYEHIRQDEGQSPQVTETGTYSIAVDGRYRVDRRSPDAATFEIFDPAKGTRTIVNLDQRRAFVQTKPFAMMSGPAGQMPGNLHGLDPDRIGSIVEEHIPEMRQPGNMALMPGQEFLGKRTIGIIEVEGIRSVETLPDGTEISYEMWLYFRGSAATLTPGGAPMLPLQLEHRFVLPGLVEEKRVTGVTSAYVSTDLFAVPESIPIVRERPRRRVPSPDAR